MFYVDSITPLEAALWFVDMEAGQELVVQGKPFVGIVLSDELMCRVMDGAWAGHESPGNWVRGLIEKAQEFDTKVGDGSRPSIDRSHRSEEVEAILERIRGKQRGINETAAGEVAPQR